MRTIEERLDALEQLTNQIWARLEERRIEVETPEVVRETVYEQPACMLDVFPEVRHLMSYTLKPDAILPWWHNTSTFTGTTPEQFLRYHYERAVIAPHLVRDDDFSTVLQQIVRPFYDALGNASAPGTIPMEELVEICCNRVKEHAEECASQKS